MNEKSLKENVRSKTMLKKIFAKKTSLFAAALAAACLAMPLMQTAEAAAAKPAVTVKQEKISAQDSAELSQLVLWERQAKVRKLQAELADCYWPDATVTTSWTAGPVADYLKAGAAQKNRAEASAQERILNRSSAPIVHQSGNRAYVELPTDGIHWIKVNGEDAVWTSHMRLIYRCEKRNGVWKISDLTSIFESDKLEPVVPGTDLHIDPKDVEGLRPSYRWLAYVRKQAGGQVSNDMTGTDRPEEISRIYQMDDAWLHGGKLEGNAQ